ncbi:MAG: hypothetical protein MPW15_28340 [Candidatus Manganitrophus sp.]|nr:hypothetical protein [Candidatus Manganitrophus sp.]
MAAPFWTTGQWGWWLLSGYFISTILLAATPSRQDIKLGSPSLLLYGTVGGLWWLWGSPSWRAWFQ